MGNKWTDKLIFFVVLFVVCCLITNGVLRKYVNAWTSREYLFRSIIVTVFLAFVCMLLFWAVFYFAVFCKSQKLTDNIVQTVSPWKLFFKILVTNLIVMSIYYVVGVYKKTWIAIVYAGCNLVLWGKMFSLVTVTILSFSTPLKMLYTSYIFIEIYSYSFVFWLGYVQIKSKLLYYPLLTLCLAALLEVTLLRFHG